MIPVIGKAFQSRVENLLGDETPLVGWSLFLSGRTTAIRKSTQKKTSNSESPALSGTTPPNSRDGEFSMNLVELKKMKIKKKMKKLEKQVIEKENAKS